MKLKKAFLIVAALGAITANAEPPQSFQNFRQRVLDDYQDFRSTILDHYADFLNGTWHEYETLAPKEKSKVIKPSEVPNITLDKPSDKPVELPRPTLADIPVPVPTPDEAVEPETETPEEDTPEVAEEPAQTEPESKMPPSPFDKPKTVTPLEAKGIVPLTVNVKPDMGNAPLLPLVSAIPGPKVPDTAVPETQPADNEGPSETIKFYGMEIQMPKVDFQIMQSMGRVADFARNWKLIDKQEVTEDLLDAVKPQIQKMGLNDYLTYEFLCAYADSKFPEAAAAPKLSVVHYLLSHLGYDARIALATKTGDPLILMPTKQTVYGKTYLTINKENFYVMAAPGVNVMGSPIATCDLPKLASSAGKKFDLTLKGLNLPMKEYKFDIEKGKLHLTGTLNANMMPVVYRYPQMSMTNFAESFLDENLRKSLVEQVKAQLGDMDKLEATNELLKFVQSGFAYSTDDAYHGFEKPYFLEENLFYPKNDCEDRAIFYTYLLWNALGVENHLLFFPGHESASVSLPVDIKGTSYMHNGKRYYISDPTYVGSRTGQCMPQYERETPKIDRTLPE